jgi:hypothetical protein
VTAGPAIHASFAAIDPEETWIDASLGPAPAGDGWIRLDELSEPGPMGALRAAAAEETGETDPRTVGAMMAFRYAAVPSLAARVFARDRRVPDLRPSSVAFRPFTDDAPTGVRVSSPAFACLPDDPDAGAAEATVVSDVGELAGCLARTVEGLFDPVVGAFRDATRLGDRALWAIVGSETLVALARASAGLGEPRRGLREAAMVADAGSRIGHTRPDLFLAGAADAPVLIVGLAACCRAYRWPHRVTGYCTTCPIRPREERLALQLANASGDA